VLDNWAFTIEGLPALSTLIVFKINPELCGIILTY